jgi:hypothetical protein
MLSEKCSNWCSRPLTFLMRCPLPPVWHTSIFDCEGFKGGPHTFSIPRPYRMHTCHTNFQGRIPRGDRFMAVVGVLRLLAGHINFPRSFPAPFEAQFVEKSGSKKNGRRKGCRPPKARSPKPRRPNPLVRSTTEYKYGESGEIIGKLRECFCDVFSVGCEKSWRAGLAWPA